MINQIISSVKGELFNKFQEMGLSDDKANEAAGLAKEDIADEFSREASSGNFSAIQNLFNGKQDIGSSSLVNSIIRKYSGSLISKLGLNPDMAAKISGFAIPFIMSKINDKTPSEGIGKDDLMDIVGSHATGNFGKGLKDKLGGLFGS